MATLTGSTIASSYDQLLALPSGGGNGATLVALTDGNAGNTFALKLSTGEVNSTGTLSVAGVSTFSGDIRLEDDAGGEYVGIASPSAVTTYTLTMPAAVGASGQVLETSDGSGTLAWVTREVGDITGVTAGTNLSGGGTSGTVTLNVDNPVVADLTGDVTGDVTGNITATSVLANGVTATTQSASDNSTKVATTAYVDSQVETSDTLAEVLANGNTTGSTNIIVSASQSITTDTVSETTSAAGVTIDSVLVKDNTVTATTFTGALTGNVTGNCSGTAATVTGAAQTAITSVGTLSSLAVTGDLTVDTDTLYVDSGNDNVGIGTTSPSVGGLGSGYQYLTIEGSASARLELGSTAADASGLSVGSLEFVYPTNSSGYRRIAQVVGTTEGTTVNQRGGGLSFQTKPDGGTSLAARMTITEAGLVGIGEASPASILQVKGSTGVSFGTLDAGILITNVDGHLSLSNADTGSGSPALSFESDLALASQGEINGIYFGGRVNDTPTYGAWASIRGAKENTTADNYAGSLRFYTNGASNSIAERMRIDDSGNVGIGTTSPAHKLDIAAGYVKLDASYGYGWGDLNTGMFGRGTADANSYLGLRVNGSPNALHIDSSGNVGIGDSDPDQPLSIIKASAACVVALDASTTTYDSVLLMRNEGADKWSIRNRGADDNFSIYSYSAADDVIEITPAGLVGIGGTPTSAKLEVFGDSLLADGKLLVTNTSGNTGAIYNGAVATGDIRISGGSSSTNGAGIVLYGGSHSATPDVTIFQTGSTEQVRISSDGAIGLSGANYGTSGQVLTSGGASASPTWTTVSGSSAWTTSGSDIYYDTGNVGIGTSTGIDELFHLQAGSPFIQLEATSNGGTAGIKYVDDGGTHRFTTGFDDTTNTYRIAVGDGLTTTPVTVDNSGRVGIGTAVPEANLQVTGSQDDIWAARIENTHSSGYGMLTKIAGTAATDLAFQVRSASTNHLTVLGDGNVGIGTNAPTAPLHVIGQIQQAVETTTSTVEGSVSYAVDFSDSNLQKLVLHENDSDLTITTSNRAAGRTVRLFIDCSASLSPPTISAPSWITFGLDISSFSGTYLIMELTSWGTTDAEITAQIEEDAGL